MTSTKIRETTTRHSSFLLCIAAFLVFIGNFRFWLGDSAITLPLGIFPVFISLFTINKIEVNKIDKDIYLIMVLISSGLLATLLNPDLNFTRSAASMLPFFTILLTLVASASINYKSKIESYIDFGTVFLACAVIFLSVSIQTDIGVENAQIYNIKSSIETPLGFSNYLASFLLFSTIRNSYRNWSLSLITFIAMIFLISRFSIFVAIIFLLYRSYIYNPKMGVVGMISFGSVIVFCLVTNLDLETALNVRAISDTSSAESRRSLWVLIIEQSLKNPLFGVGPGGLKNFITNNAGAGSQELWDPHNSIISLLSSFGILGLISYSTYLIRAMKSMWISSKSSDIWMGNFLGILAMLIQSLFEPIVSTVGFEFLLALLYGQSLQHLSGFKANLK